MTSILLRTGAMVSLVAACAAAQDIPVTRFVQVEPGVNIEVLDWGGRGRPIVFLHGHGRSAHDFRGFAEKFGPAYHVYALSRRGYGASSKPRAGYSADRLADDVLAVLDSLGIVNPVLAGHSLGGAELSNIGSRHPGRVAGLVYLDAAYGYAFYDLTAPDPSDDFINPNEVRRGLEELRVAAWQGKAEVVHEVIARMLTTDLPALERTLQDLASRTPRVSSNPPRGFLMQTTVGPDREIFDGLKRYTAVSIPVLAIFALKGMGDSTVIAAWRDGRRREVAAMRRAAPNARTVILHDASHDVWKSKEADVLREMRSFMEGITSRRPPGD